MIENQQPVATVFGSGRAQPADESYRTARALGAALARAGYAVATGGYGGAMEAVSRGANQAGGRVIGVTAEVFATAPNRWVTEEIRVPAWHDRLLKLVELGAGYVVLPGGTGTLVELAVVWEWINKGFLPQRPVILLGDFWARVVEAIPASELRLQPVRQATTVEAAVALLREELGVSPRRD